MSDDPLLQSRRNALKCMAYGGAGTLFVLAGGVFTPIDLAMARADDKPGTRGLGKPLFVQISDTHIGFNKEANPDVNGTLTQTIDLVNGMSEQPALIIHTGDITHLSRPAEFDLAQQMLSRLRTTEMHTVPGEHDTTDADRHGILQPLRQGIRQQGLLQLRSRRRALHRAGQRAAVQAGRSRHPGRRAARLGGGRPEGTLGQHADRGLRAHAALDHLRAVGLGHRAMRISS